MPGIGGWRGDRASADQTMVIVVEARPTPPTVWSVRRRQQAHYSPVPSMIVLHMQQENVRSAWCR